MLVASKFLLMFYPPGPAASKQTAKAGPGLNGIVIDYDLVLRHVQTAKIFVNQAVIYNQIIDFTIVNPITIH